jgi:hypothetical protein
MYVLTLTLKEDDKILQTNAINLDSLDYAHDLMNLFTSPIEHDDDEQKHGEIITPLPPDQVHSVEGIVTPKAPVQFSREQAAKHNKLPKELTDDHETLFPTYT